MSAEIKDYSGLVLAEGEVRTLSFSYAKTRLKQAFGLESGAGMAANSAASTTTVHPEVDPTEEMLGMSNDKPGWEDFPRLLDRYLRSINERDLPPED